MVKRKTIFRGIFVEEHLKKEFEDLMENEETQTKTLRRIIDGYKSKCPNLEEARA
jgi:hypothetical protein